MYNRKATAPQLGAWIAGAMAAPLTQFVAREPWPTAALAAAIGCLLCLLAWKWTALDLQMPGWLWVLEWCWLAALLPGILSKTGLCWPDAQQVPTIPLILLLLAVLSAEQGASRAARVSATAFWLIGLLLAGILGAGVKELSGQWLLPVPTVPKVVSFWVFLLPALLVLMPRERYTSGGWLLGIGCLGIVVAAWTGAVISPQLAAEEPSAFYLYSESLTMLGAAKRMEALASSALTMSWFCLLSWMLTASGHAAEKIHEGWGKLSVWGAALAAAIVLFLGWEMPSWAAAAGSVVLWICIPILTRKSEKRA